MQPFPLLTRLSLCDARAVGITPQQFAAMQSRVSAVGRKRAATPVLERTACTPMVQNQVLLGIDPSLRGTGYGVIRFSKARPTLLEFGTISVPVGWERSRCLVKISQTVRRVVQEHRPAVCVVEGLFYAQNLQTALIMGEARGACLAAVAEAGLEIYEIAPRKVKQSIVGYGAAQKIAVAKMVQRMLNLAEPPPADAADALALALAYGQESSRFQIGGRKRI